MSARALACESCGSGGSRGSGLAVELMVPTDALADRFELEESGSGAFDALAWRTYYLRLQRFRTMCGACARERDAAAAGGAKPGDLSAAIRNVVTTRTDTGLGAVDASVVAREIARAWIAKARARIAAFQEAGPGAVPLPPGAVLALGEEEDEAAGRGVAISARPVVLTSASIALATRWLAEARKKLLRR